MTLLRIASWMACYVLGLCILGCNQRVSPSEKMSAENATPQTTEKIVAERIDHAEVSVESEDPFEPVGVDFDFEKLEGVWLSYRVAYGKNTYLSSRKQIRIDIVPQALADPLHPPTAVYGSSHELRMYGRASNQVPWESIGSDSWGGIDIQDDATFFCFGPFGSQLRLKLRSNGKQLQLQGGEFDDLRLSRVAVDKE